MNPEGPHVGSSVCPRVGPTGVPAAVVRRCGGPLGNTSQGTPRTWASGRRRGITSLEVGGLRRAGRLGVGAAAWTCVGRKIQNYNSKSELDAWITFGCVADWGGAGAARENLGWALGSFSGVSRAGAARALPAGSLGSAQRSRPRPLGTAVNAGVRKL